MGGGGDADEEEMRSTDENPVRSHANHLISNTECAGAAEELDADSRTNRLKGEGNARGVQRERRPRC